MLGDRRPWIATELVEGASLATTLARSSITALDAAAIVRDVATILEYAHGRGLVHCNVTPASIVMPDVHRRFPIALVDWSGARAHDSISPAPLVPSLRGRPYAAPELRVGEVVTGRADIYSLGMVARELLPARPRRCLPRSSSACWPPTPRSARAPKKSTITRAGSPIRSSRSTRFPR
jgi:serine/threonine protein kinase